MWQPLIWRLDIRYCYIDKKKDKFFIFSEFENETWKRNLLTPGETEKCFFFRFVIACATCIALGLCGLSFFADVQTLRRAQWRYGLISVKGGVSVGPTTMSPDDDHEGVVLARRTVTSLKMLKKRITVRTGLLAHRPARPRRPLTKAVCRALINRIREASGAAALVFAVGLVAPDQSTSLSVRHPIAANCYPIQLSRIISIRSSNRGSASGTARRLFPPAPSQRDAILVSSTGVWLTSSKSSMKMDPTTAISRRLMYGSLELDPSTERYYNPSTPAVYSIITMSHIDKSWRSRRGVVTTTVYSARCLSARFTCILSRLLLILFITTWQQNERKTSYYAFWTFPLALPPFSDDTIEFKLDRPTSSTTAPTVFFFRQVVLHVLQTERKRKQHPLKAIGAIILCLEESIPSLGARQVTFVAATAHSFFFLLLLLFTYPDGQSPLTW